MLNYIQNLLSVADPDQLYQLDEKNIQNFPFYFFLKNQIGNYIGCNDSMANMLGFDKGRDLLGCTDYDLCWRESAPTFRKNDKEVITSEKPKITIETGRLIHGKNTSAFSYKLPLRLRSQKIAGVVCIAIPFDSDESLSGMLNDIKANPGHVNIHQYKFSVDAVANKKNLTRRQKDCLYFLLKGMTLKEIASVLNLSPRTVEHHVEALKAKLNCNSRSQLIEKTLEQ